MKIVHMTLFRNAQSILTKLLQNSERGWEVTVSLAIFNLAELNFHPRLCSHFCAERARQFPNQPTNTMTHQDSLDTWSHMGFGAVVRLDALILVLYKLFV